MSKDNIKKLLQEVIVNFDGIEYDIPEDESQQIQKQIEFGDQTPSAENSRKFSLGTASQNLSSALGKSGPKAMSILQSFSPNIQGQALKIISNNIDEIAQGLFSVSPGLGKGGTIPPGAWLQLSNLDEKGLGKGEVALSLFMRGVAPDGGGGAHDLVIDGVGDVHVKDVSGDNPKPGTAFKNPDVRMGKQLNRSDKTIWYRSIELAVPSWEGKSLTQTVIKANAKAILDQFSLQTQSIASTNANPSLKDYDLLADMWQDDLTQAFRNSEAWGGAAGLMIVDSRTGSFLLAGPTDMAPSRIDQGKWRAGLTSKKSNLWANVLKAGVKSQLSEGYLLRNLIREALIQEELTKSDKREIDKLIKKAIEKDRGEQKKLVRKEIEDELVKSLGKSFFRQPGKIRKTIIDVCQEELAKEMQKGSKMEKSVVDVTKKVLSAWHELLYKQQHIINRVKI